MLSHGLGMAGLAFLGTALTAAVVQRTTHPFREDDAQLVERLDMPAPLKRLVLRVLKFVAR
jgi:hypothetical protein